MGFNDPELYHVTFPGSPIPDYTALLAGASTAGTVVMPASGLTPAYKLSDGYHLADANPYVVLNLTQPPMRFDEPHHVVSWPLPIDAIIFILAASALLVSASPVLGRLLRDAIETLAP